MITVEIRSNMENTLYSTIESSEKNLETENQRGQQQQFHEPLAVHLVRKCRKHEHRNPNSF